MMARDGAIVGDLDPWEGINSIGLRVGALLGNAVK